VFFNGERVARRDLVSPTGVFYYFSDHLKTASVITDSGIPTFPQPPLLLAKPLTTGHFTCYQKRTFKRDILIC
ncbi:MAG: hypothetical protein ACRD4F_18090, partial [Candidatus Angelobacter sp.]